MTKRDECCLDVLRREILSGILEDIQKEGISSLRSEDQEAEVLSPTKTCEIKEILDNPYRNRDKVELHMDIFVPELAEETELPVIVTLHGGGQAYSNRNIPRREGRSLARRGYLVFSLEYRPAPQANVFQQLDDVCAGMDLIDSRLSDYNVDYARIFLITGSAGAFLAIYVAAMKKSGKLKEAIGYEPAQMTFKALGLYSGMFYIKRDDPVGWLLKDQLYGKKLEDDTFLQYLDPEHEEILTNLPPVFLTTSRGDFLNKHTLMYHEALKKAGKTSHLVYYGDSDLDHLFPIRNPNLPQSVDVIDKMCDWFEDQAAEDARRQKDREKEEESRREIRARLESGQIIDQKSWLFIKELNSWSEERMNKPAIIDGRREYSYRQMFRKWESYAEVFSSLGITGRDHARVGMTGTPCAETLFAFYGLNMTGTSVSMIHFIDVGDPDRWRELIPKEKITDLVLTDHALNPDLLKEILKIGRELGIRHVIILHVPFAGPLASPAEQKKSRINYEVLKKMQGILFMDDLLEEYEAMPIIYGEEENDEAAVIIHTSGTVSGIHKPIPLSDRAFNESAARLVRDQRFENLFGKTVSCQGTDYSFSYAMIDGNHLPLAFGGTIVMVPSGGLGLSFAKAVSHYKANILFAGGAMFAQWEKKRLPLNLSHLKFVFLGGNYVSALAKKRYDAYLKKCGAKVQTSIGYGLSEVGAACILSSPDRKDDAIGYPLSGVTVRIYDEEEDRYYSLEDGPRTGVLFLSSASLSSGRIDDTVFFETVSIDGQEYLNTYDLVRVNEDGSMTYAGRMDKYFVNNEGIRFDAGLVETALSACPGIAACGLAPEYDKILHDSIPVLYVQTASGAGNPTHIIRRALRDVFIKDNRIAESNLPGKCVITERIPFNAGGKVDVYRIMKGEVAGRAFTILPVRENGQLKDIRLLAGFGKDIPAFAAPPQELEADMQKMIKDVMKKDLT